MVTFFPTFVCTKMYIRCIKSRWLNEHHLQYSFSWLVDCRCKANCPFVGPGPIGGVPSVGVFLRDPSPHLLEFRKKPRKTPNG